MDRFTLTLGEGEILLHSLLKGGAALAHDCGGKLACATCCVIVREGGQTLSGPTDDELDILERAGLAQDGARLACQVSGSGEVVVDIRSRGLRGASPHGSARPVALDADAARFLARELAKDPGAVGLRLAVVPAGCSGLRYRVDPAEAVGEDDVVFDSGGLRLVVDQTSLPFLQGATVQLAKEGPNRRLRFDNPNAKHACGCGESFDT
jgi:iron-sulfur cluster assembly protein